MFHHNKSFYTQHLPLRIQRPPALASKPDPKAQGNLSLQLSAKIR